MMRDMSTKLIILRGPSGSGKSTVARALQQGSSRNILIIDQDYYRHILLDSKPDEKAIVPELIYQNAMITLNAGYDVIIEGIFRKEKYKPMFERLIRDSGSEVHVYYFDISFEETTKRHTTREKSNLFSAEEMKAWYHLGAPLEIEAEQHIPEYSSEQETIALIRAQTEI
jgi:predicted kinase